MEAHGMLTPCTELMSWERDSPSMPEQLSAYFTSLRDLCWISTISNILRAKTRESDLPA